MPRAVQDGKPAPAEVLADDPELTPVTGCGAWITVNPDLLASEISERSGRAMLQYA
jgi:hypothetical protein